MDRERRASQHQCIALHYRGSVEPCSVGVYFLVDGGKDHASVAFGFPSTHQDHGDTPGPRPPLPPPPLPLRPDDDDDHHPSTTTTMTTTTATTTTTLYSLYSTL